MSQAITPHVTESCLEPTLSDIVVNGIRYGLLQKNTSFDYFSRTVKTTYRAKMDLPDLIAYRDFLGYGYAEEDTRDKAVLKAFEDFAESGVLSLDEAKCIGLELFGESYVPEEPPVAVDIFAEQEMEGVTV